MIDFSDTPCPICKSKHSEDICPRCLSSRSLDREMREYFTGRSVGKPLCAYGRDLNERYSQESRRSIGARLRELIGPVKTMLEQELNKL